MNDKAQEQIEPVRKHRFFKTVKWIVLISAGVVLLIFFGIPLFLSSAGGTGFLLGKINAVVDGQVAMDDFSMGWFKGVKLRNLSYADSTGNTSVQVQRIETHPQYLSLLGGKVNLGKTVIDSPQVHLKVSSSKTPAAPADGSERLSKPTPVTSADAPPPVFPVNQIDLELINGNATVELLDGTSQTVAFTNIASTVQFDQEANTGAVDMAMTVDDSASVSANGNVKTDKKGWTVKAGDFDVKISKLQLGSLKPLLAMAGQEMELTGELNADAKISLEDNAVKQLKADVKMTDLIQGTGEDRIVFDQPVTVQADISAEGETIRIEQAKVQSQFCNVDCSGTTESLTYSIDADLARTQQFVGQFVTVPMSMVGALSAKGKAAMTDETTTVAGSGTIKNLQIQQNDVKTPMTDIQLDFDCAMNSAQEQLKIASATLVGTPGTVTVSNVIVPLSDQAEKTISVDAQAKVDLAKAWPFVQVFSEDLKNQDISGQLDAAFKVSTAGSQIRFLTENTRIDNLRVAVPDSDPFVQDVVTLNGDVLMDTENEVIDIRTLDLQGKQGESLIKITKGKIENKVSSTNTHMTGDFVAEYDWRAVSALGAAYLPEGLAIEGNRTDTFHFESVYPTNNPDAMIAGLNANGAIGFDRAEYYGLNVGPTELKMTVKQGVADFEIPETTVNEGKLRFAGVVDLKEPSKVLRLKESTQVLENVHITEEMTRTMLTHLSPVFAGQGDINGFVNFKCDQLSIPFSAEETNKLFMDAVVSIDNAQLEPKGALNLILRKQDIKPIPLQLLPSRFVLQNEVVSYDAMEFLLDQYPTGFSGTLGLNSYANMTIALPWRIDVEERGFRSVKVGEDLSTRLKVVCQGPVTDFAKCIRFDAMLDDALKDVIEDQILKGLEGILRKNL